MVAKFNQSRELKEFANSLRDDLVRILNSASQDGGDYYGFALVVPDEWGHPALMYTVGSEVNLKGEDPNSRLWIGRRYDPREWENDWRDIGSSQSKLEEVVNRFKTHAAELEWSSSQVEREGARFLTQILNTYRKVMLQCNREGLYGDIWYKVMFMPDDSHPVLVDAFQQLNAPKIRIKSQYLFPGISQRIYYLLQSQLRALRTRWVRWRIGAKR